MEQANERACVLVIDDSPMELRALSMILSATYDVKIAKDGYVGLELAIRNRVDLILVDLSMPGMSGFEVLKALKEDEDLSEVPVIIVTGSESGDDEVKGLEMGAADFIRKPFLDAVVKLRVGLHLQLRRQLKLVEGFSLMDGLTGIGNRRNFDQTILSEFRRSARAKEPIGLLMVDIDNFKRFNDRYGHINGDTCLKVVAKAMADVALRGSDFVFRWGGEEFIVLLSQTPLEGAVVFAERLRQTIEELPMYCGDEVTSATVSIGVGATYPAVSLIKDRDTDFEDDIKEFMININKALHRAKANGRNRVEAFDPTNVELNDEE